MELDSIPRPKPDIFISQMVGLRRRALLVIGKIDLMMLKRANERKACGEAEEQGVYRS